MSHATHIRTFAWILLFVVALVVGGSYLTGFKADWVEMLDGMRDSPGILLTTASIYAVCLAIPFVPGLEIGLMLMILFGRSGILMAYSGTVIGLTLAFTLGLFLRNHFVGYPIVDSWREKARRFQKVGADQMSRSRFGLWLQSHLVKGQKIYPYLMTGALFNVPGNWLIGGGGGIALIGGLSGQMRWLPFILTVMLATSIVPLLAWFGLIELQRWLPTP